MIKRIIGYTLISPFVLFVIMMQIMLYLIFIPFLLLGIGIELINHNSIKDYLKGYLEVMTMWMTRKSLEMREENDRQLL